MRSTIVNYNIDRGSNASDNLRANDYNDTPDDTAKISYVKNSTYQSKLFLEGTLSN